MARARRMTAGCGIREASLVIRPVPTVLVFFNDLEDLFDIVAAHHLVLDGETESWEGRVRRRIEVPKLADDASEDVAPGLQDAVVEDREGDPVVCARHSTPP